MTEAGLLKGHMTSRFLGEVMKDLKRVVKASQPHVEKLVNKVKDLRSK